MNRAAKGNYYVMRTKEWLESLGYVVAKLESTKRIMIRDKTNGALKPIFTKNDIWGSDLVARNSERIVFVQVKANAGDITKGMRQLSEGDWPPHVGRWVIYWPAGRRLEAGPEIEEVTQ